MLAQALEWLRMPAAIVFVFGLVIFVHELGHFLVAKWMGVYAPRFSIGFGPALWKRRWGETEYVLAAVPLGGYVRMASREDKTMAMIEGGGERAADEPATVGGSGARVVPEENVAGDERRPADWDPDALAPFGPHPVPEHRLFESKSLPARLAIMIAGVTMNALLALVLLSGLALFKGRPVNNTTVVAEVIAPDRVPVLAQRVAPGDTILAVDGEPVSVWQDFERLVAEGTGPTVTIRTNRDEITIPVGGPGEPTRPEVVMAMAPLVPPVVAEITPESAARRAGLARGDSIVSVSGEPVAAWSDMVARIRRSPGVEIEMTYVRRGEHRTVTLVPDSVPITDPATGERIVIGLVGIGAPVEWQRLPPGQAVAQGWRETTTMTGAVLGAVRDLVTGRASVRQLGGPVRIATVSAEAARSGASYLLRLTAFISINLAILNLLPIPILDGGQILLNVVESVRGGSFSVRTREYLVRFGLAAILLLFVIVMFNDIRRLLGL